MKNIAFLLLFLLANRALIAQYNNKSSLQLNEIMKGKDFIGYWPENVAWHASGDKILFDWNPENELKMSRYSYSILDGKIARVNLNKTTENIEFDSGQQNFQEQYFTFNGNLWRYNKSTGSCIELFATEERVQNIQRLSAENLVVFQLDLNLFLFDANTGSTRQLTSFQRGKEKQIKEKNEPLSIQQIELFKFLKEELNEKEYNSNKKEKSTLTQIFLDKKQIDYLRISKDGRFVMARMGEYPDNRNTSVENFISDDGYTYNRSARPKVGEIEPIHSFSILDLELDSMYAMEFDKLTNIRKKPEYLKEYGDTITEYNLNRKIIMHPPIQSKTGEIVMDIRSYDNKDRWLIQLNLLSNSFEEIDNQHDEAWIGGPGISSWNMVSGILGFFDQDKKLYFQSEKTGYSHLYSYDFKSKKTEQLTHGTYEVRDVILSKNSTTFYLGTNQNHPGDLSYFSFDYKTKKNIPILNESGGYQLFISPSENRLAYLYSDKINPWELYFKDNSTNSNTIQITESKSEKFISYKWSNPKVISFKGLDNVDVHARLYKAEETENKPAVIFVHGAGYLQNAHNYWSVYYREFMFHNLLKDNGFTVLDIDYRASDGYGRDFRTAIYRHMGGMDLEDQISGKNYLIDSLNINPNKVGIYGGSYGGFITLMALLTKPNEFACGAALRSVTDWMHYNHEYTSNILNYPNTDSMAYRKSSPIYFAQNLNKPLLLLHGMIDDNVQFQDVVRLSQRFIELEKDNWDLAVYPIEAHGFQKSYSWTDEYRRIFELFSTHLLETP